MMGVEKKNLLIMSFVCFKANC